MKISDLFESQKLLIVDESAKDFIDEIEIEMEKVADSFANEVKSATTRGAAPDSSKFRATVGGMIEVEKNVHVHGGQYGSPKTYRVFLKIGGGIDRAIATKIKKEVINRTAKFIENETVASTIKFNDHIYCDDMVVTIGEEEGTNWGGIGFSVRKYSAQEQKNRDQYDLGE